MHIVALSEGNVWQFQSEKKNVYILEMVSAFQIDYILCIFMKWVTWFDFCVCTAVVLPDGYGWDPFVVLDFMVFSSL